MTDSTPATAAGRGSIAYEPCRQDGHSHDWRDCPTPEDWATTTAATDDGPMPLREQFRQIFGTLWRVIKVNPLRVYVMAYYGLVGRFGGKYADIETRDRIAGWIEEANRGR